MARSIDFIIIGGRIAAEGIPNNQQFARGERTAVNTPAVRPYLYAAISVKKYIGRKICPPKSNE